VAAKRTRSILVIAATATAKRIGSILTAVPIVVAAIELIPVARIITRHTVVVGLAAAEL
jgi:hypothetical protein